MVKQSIAAVMICLLTAVAGSCYAEVVPTRWIGSYSYQYVMGHSVGEPAPAWDFSLTVREDGSCELTWQGYQKDDDILCKASGENGYLRIYYVSFADGTTSDPSGQQAYKPGAKLVQLKSIKNNSVLWTKWGALNKANVLKDGVRFEHD